MWALSENSWSRARYLIALINQGGVTKYGLWRAWFLPHAQPPTAEGLIHPTESHQLWGRCGISWVGFRMHYFKNGRGKTDKKKKAVHRASLGVFQPEISVIFFHCDFMEKGTQFSGEISSLRHTGGWNGEKAAGQRSMPRGRGIWGYSDSEPEIWQYRPAIILGIKLLVSVLLLSLHFINNQAWGICSN